MKTRNGFVSNSSSSSSVVVGFPAPRDRETRVNILRKLITQLEDGPKEIAFSELTDEQINVMFRDTLRNHNIPLWNSFWDRVNYDEEPENFMIAEVLAYGSGDYIHTFDNVPNFIFNIKNLQKRLEEIKKKLGLDCEVKVYGDGYYDG